MGTGECLSLFPKKQNLEQRLEGEWVSLGSGPRSKSEGWGNKQGRSESLF